MSIEEAVHGHLCTITVESLTIRERVAHRNTSVKTAPRAVGLFNKKTRNRGVVLVGAVELIESWCLFVNTPSRISARFWRSTRGPIILFARITCICVASATNSVDFKAGIQNDCFFLMHPDVIADAERMERFKSAIEFWDMTNLQDWQVCEQMQQGTRSRRFTRGLYSPAEDILHALDKEILKALGHASPDSPTASS